MSEQYHSSELLVGQREAGILSLRGDSHDPQFAAGVKAATGLRLPVAANTFEENASRQIRWIGPDDWFVLTDSTSCAPLEQSLCSTLTGTHCAVTDVSGGYVLIDLSGPAARDFLSQGCPLDLDSRNFGVGRCAGSLFFKTQIYLARHQAAPEFSMLVRRSFANYFWQLVDAGTAEMTVRSSGRL